MNTKVVMVVERADLDLLLAAVGLYMSTVSGDQEQWDEYRHLETYIENRIDLFDREPKTQAPDEDKIPF